MRGSFFSAAKNALPEIVTALLVASMCVVGVAYIPGCDALDGDSSDGDAGGCNGATCTSSQFCLYRECTAAEKCVASTDPCDGVPSCALSDGTGGCESTACSSPVVQGCRDIPSSCGNDVGCACDSVCGSASMCEGVDGGSATCTGS